MKEMIKNTVILTVITLVAGLLLGGVYQITKEPIASVQKATEDKACAQVFEDAASFDTDFEMPSDGQDVLAANGLTAQTIDKVIAAKDASDKVLGYVLTVTSKEGYGGDITFMMGVDNEGIVKGIYMLSISETAGLGMNAKNEEFLDQYVGKDVDSFVVTKSGAAADSDIDAITGATITSRAVTNGVNAGRCYVLEVLKEGE